MRNRFWIVFALVFGWYAALYIFSAQPVPANDAFFYDGSVIHHLLYGGYYNPAIAAAFPISGTEVFSAYPPFYQIPLLAWMSVFGCSALSAMGLHLTLLGLYMLVLLAIFKRLQTPAWCVNVAGTFFLLLTFHDRPDTLAHVLGVLAVYAWVRSRRIFATRINDPRDSQWTWLMVLFGVLSLCTSLQIGAIYLAWVWLGTTAVCLIGKERFPVIALLANLIVPVVLLALVMVFLPTAWAGFLENVHQTPFLTGLRIPYWQEVAKVVRTVPGVILVLVLLPWAWFTQRKDFASTAGIRQALFFLPVLVLAAGVCVVSVCVLSPNTSATIVCYLQPAVVASYLALWGTFFVGRRWIRAQVVFLLLAMLMGSTRAVGMTTWGLACARDVSYSSAIARVRRELDKQPPGTEVVLSSAFLYEAARHKDIHWVHSDWLEPAGDRSNFDPHGLIKHKPAQLILTQFDYYRRYQQVLEGAEGDPHLAGIQVENTAKIPAPDSIHALQQVVQNISWAPVIVNLTWK